jgi:hypothetical protein
MWTPAVNEITLRLEPVTHDPFIDDLEPPSSRATAVGWQVRPLSHGAHGKGPLPGDDTPARLVEPANERRTAREHTQAGQRGQNARNVVYTDMDAIAA